MRVYQGHWEDSTGWSAMDIGADTADLVLYFGDREFLSSRPIHSELAGMFPRARIAGCSTGGQIQYGDIAERGISLVALSFDRTAIRVVSERLVPGGVSRDAGRAIGLALDKPGLAGIFVLSDGLHVNGSELVRGITSVVAGVPVTGGLAGDGDSFEATLVGADSEPSDRTVVAVGFYGGAIRIGHAAGGGWEVFGPRRRITRSSGNVLYSLDGEPALNLYERYLGEDEASRLPGSGLLFPLQIHQPPNTEHTLVRTVLSIDRDERSMTFAGDIPEGWVGQLMRGDLDRLTEGAVGAASEARAILSEAAPSGVAILVSCIGRKLLLGQRITDEIEAASEELGSAFVPIGFYSYGEISPHSVSGFCELHNQTMTITTIAEAVA